MQSLDVLHPSLVHFFVKPSSLMV